MKINITEIKRFQPHLSPSSIELSVEHDSGRKVSKIIDLSTIKIDNSLGAALLICEALNKIINNK